MRSAAVLLLLVTASCAHRAPAPPVAQPQAVETHPATPQPPPTAAAPAPVETKPAPQAAGNDAPPVARPPAATAAAPKPAAPPAAAPKPTAPPVVAAPKPAAPRAAAAPAPAPRPAPPPAAAPPAAAPPAPAAPAPLDLSALKEQLKETKAIGVFTKISLKNKVDDLMEQFREYYQGKTTLSLKQLRQSYDLLLMKVLSLLQDADQRLAAAIVASREAIWGLLSDQKKFEALEG